MAEKKKALFINGSPRKNKNTAQMLQKAMEGAEVAGAEVEMIDLYSLDNVKGCMSCFVCKLKNDKKKGVCFYKDGLSETLQKAYDADVLVVGSPCYCSYPSAYTRAFMERLIFGALNYSDYSKPFIDKVHHSATIYTMNAVNEEMYKAAHYDLLMDASAQQLGMFGPTEIMKVYDTYQFNDYNRYEAATFNESHKRQVREEQFPKDLKRAYDLGRRLVENAYKE